MGWFLGVVSYLALDVFVMFVLGSANQSAASAGASKSRRAEIAWWIALPLLTVSFVQFYVLTRSLLWPQLLIVLALGALSWYISVIVQGSLRLRTIGNQNKVLVTTVVRNMDVNKIGSGMIAIAGLVAYVLADVLVLRTYLNGSLVGPERIVQLAIVHFTVRGTLLLFVTVLMQTVIATNKEYDDDVRYSLTITQMAGIIGAVYLVLVPLFTYGTAAVRNGPLPSFFTGVPVWTLFAAYLGVYLVVWTGGFLSSSIQHASQSDEFSSWRTRWLDRTHAVLTVGDSDERRTDIEDRLRRLLSELTQFRESKAVSAYMAFLTTPAVTAEMLALSQQPGMSADVQAEIARFMDVPREAELDQPVATLFDTYRYDLYHWDIRFDHVHELYRYIHLTSLYLVGTSTDDEYQRVIDDEIKSNQAATPSKAGATVSRVKFVAAISGTLAVLSVVFKFVEQWYPVLKRLLQQL